VLTLVIEACERALEMAGPTTCDVDRLTTCPGPSLDAGGHSPLGATEVMLSTGLDPTWVGASTDGHARMGASFEAIIAVASGLCRHVLVFRTVAQTYFEKYGATEAQPGAIAVHSRAMSAKSPNAIYREPIAIGDYLQERVISWPLRLLDCDTHVNGSTAPCF
jgi:acetyl-CoA acetyltransferase